MKTKEALALCAQLVVGFASCKAPNPLPAATIDGKPAEDVQVAVSDGDAGVLPEIEVETAAADLEDAKNPEAAMAVEAGSDMAGDALAGDADSQGAAEVPAAGGEIVADFGTDSSADQDQQASSVADADTGQPQPQCADKYSGGPTLGKSCDTPGEIHCTDVGAVTGFLKPGTGELICRRPNRLQCSTDAAGVLKWQLLPCPPLQVGCKDSGDPFPTCIEYSDGAVCASFYVANAGEVCFPDQVGVVKCGGPVIVRCQKFSEPAGDAWANLVKKDPTYVQAAACCPNCRYFWPWKGCPGVNYCDCKEIPAEVCPNYWGSAASCNFGPKGQEPKCATNCAELLQDPEWANKKPP